jgi:hypothetical protein
MTHARRTIKPVAVAWLVCHLWIGALVSGVVYAQGSVDSSEIACHCQHGDGHECPMHKTTNGKARCEMRAVRDVSGIAGVTTLLWPIGLVRDGVDTNRRDEGSSALLIMRFDVFDRATPPTPPPPRT